jgi:hypothetical protein
MSRRDGGLEFPEGTFAGNANFATPGLVPGICVFRTDERIWVAAAVWVIPALVV